MRNPNIELITLIYKGYVGLIMKLIAKKSSVFMTQVIPKKATIGKNKLAYIYDHDL